MLLGFVPSPSRTLVAGMFLLTSAVATSVLPPVATLHAGLEEGGGGAQVLIGKDNDNINNPLIQPAGVIADQSLDNTDILSGGAGPDVLIGLLGSDVLFGNAGNDILVGGTEQGSRPNSDIMFGGAGNDVSLWAGGDGSELFVGGPGHPTTAAGAPARVRTGRALEQASVATYLREDKSRDRAAWLARIVDRSGVVRAGGAGTLELAWIAAGRVDAFAQPNVSPWDWVPGAALVRHAGGTATVLDGDPAWHLAGSPALVEALAALVPRA
jgi:hypothetical protein